MSGEILKALTQLFAIVTKQDGGVSEVERGYVLRFFEQELDRDSIPGYLKIYDEQSGYVEQTEIHVEDTTVVKQKTTSVQDSLLTLNICKRINRTLTQKQKIVVLIQLLELLKSDDSFTPQRMEIINTVSLVFNIVDKDYKQIESFVTSETSADLDYPDVLLMSNSDPNRKHQRFLISGIMGEILVLRIRSAEMYFVKYLGDESHLLNSFAIKPNRVYLFSHGSTIKTQTGNALYYSDMVANFNEEIRTTKLSFNATIEEFKFPNGVIGIRNVHISEGPGKLIGIMGASGAGKTTLLNVLAGLEKPTKGKILINQFNLHEQKDKIHGVIGYVSQDDLLIEELTVYQNLYYNAKLCFANYSEEQINKRVIQVLQNLGLDQRKDLKVGSILDKKISGGQRKRLNIALELIREPAILFLDEPTSGLSSRDSENVIDLLKELSLKGKLIFVVIHQPSSDIYKMFDKMIIMDTGGYPAFYGHPIEAVSYFKKATNQVNSERGQCETCGNVTSEQIFNLLEAKVVDEYGQSTAKRKISPTQWFEMFQKKFNHQHVEDVKEKPPINLSIPSKIKQAIIFTKRDLLSKISNKQYLIINLLEAPLLALILSFVIRYRSAPGGQEYGFRFNDNMPAFILMAIIVSLFMGLTVSAEEIIRDRKILKRESFLNLSWNSYLQSKLTILFMLSAVQALAFVLIGNWILEIKGMTFAFWAVLFSTSCMANVLGLNISSAFNSAITVYILIPLLLIPQMILSGLLFSFDKLHPLISSKDKVPLVADAMVSRWAYEAIAVHQFQNNEYYAPYFEYEKEQAKADFKAAYVADFLRDKNFALLEKIETKSPIDPTEFKLLKNELLNEPFRKGIEHLNFDKDLAIEGYTPAVGKSITLFLDEYKKHYQKIYNNSVDLMEKKMAFFEQKGYNLSEEKNLYYNEKMADLVRNITVEDRLLEYKGEIIQQINPVFQEVKPANIFDYRTLFFLAEKNLFGITVSTFLFNLVVIWLMSISLYILLYFEILLKIVNSFGNMNLPLPKAK